MRVHVAIAICGALLCGAVDNASAQDWTGGYIGGSVGGAFLGNTDAETVLFDTNLDGQFNDTVNTLAGANAFSTGFCGGLAVNATAASGCSADENGLDVGGRLGYDWQMGALVFGGLVDVSMPDITDYATAFSTTPAFYSFTRNVQYTAGFRGRVGVAASRVLIYGTGGPAWGSIGQRFTSSNTANVFVPVNQEAEADDEGIAHERVWGYQAGGGVEFALGAHWGMTGEYLYSNFDNRDESSIRSTRGTAAATNPFVLVNANGTELRRSDALQFQSVRVGLNYRF